MPTIPYKLGIGCVHMCILRMFFVLCVAILGLSPSSNGCCVARGGESKNDRDAVKWFHDEYPSAAASWEQSFGHLMLEFTIRYGDEKEVHCRYFGNDQSFRFDREDQDGTVVANVFDSGRRIGVHKRREQEMFQIDLIRSASEAERSESVRSNAIIPCAAASVFEFRIVDFINGENVIITDGSIIQDEGVELVRIDWEDPYRDDDGKEQVRSGWFVFEPARNWALREFAFSWRMEATGRLYATLDYETLADGAFVVKRVEKYSQQKDSGELKARETYELKSVDAKPAPREHFKMSAFGLPDDLLKGGSSWTLRLFGLTVVLILAAVLCFVLKRRIQDKS
jgi:hypothetical protein